LWLEENFVTMKTALERKREVDARDCGVRGF